MMNEAAWYKLYQEVLLDSDSQKLLERVHRAEYAMVLRLRELRSATVGDQERRAVYDGLKGLLRVKTHTLHFPLPDLGNKARDNGWLDA